MWTLDALEQQLSTSLRIWREWSASRRKKERLQAEYHRGLATGIYISLGATGHADRRERVAHRFMKEEPSEDAMLAGLIVGWGLRS